MNAATKDPLDIIHLDHAFYRFTYKCGLSYYTGSEDSPKHIGIHSHTVRGLRVTCLWCLAGSYEERFRFIKER